MKITAMLFLWLGLGLGAHAAEHSMEADAVGAAMADPARPIEQVQQDAWRRPADVIKFAGIKRGDRIADFMSGNGYFTRLFSGVVGPAGRVYAFLPKQEIENCAPQETQGTFALQKNKNYPNVTVLIADAERFSVPEQLDMVWTAQNYHDLHDKFMAPNNVTRINTAIFNAIKPGGVFLVIDHAADSGSGLRDTERLHRIDSSAVISEVTAAGFKFESESRLLRNPDDSHALIVFDPSIRHRTDQFILKFKKPVPISGAGAAP
jgi:predicted methyltransferase